ncbi:MAG: YraN family protein [Minisyncoccota bacterium]
MDRPDKRTEKRKLGDLGENIACDYLERHGFEILDRNYLRKWGELDIVAEKKGIIHFIEVKSVSHVTLSMNVTHVTPTDTYRPEENVHPWKLKRLSRAMQTYILEKRLDDREFQLDIITVKIDQNSRKARVEMIENVVI